MNPAAAPLVPAEWVLTLLNVSSSEFAAYTASEQGNDIGSITLALEFSDNAEHLLSAIASMTYMLSHDKDPESICERTINCLKLQRWKELVSISTVVMRESVRLLRFRTRPPSASLIECIGPFVVCDPSSIEILVEIWEACNWPLSLEFIFTIQNSYQGWKFINRLNVQEVPTSRSIIEEMVTRSRDNADDWICHGALLGSNGSALEYLIFLDTLNAEGIKSTAQVIRDYSLWGTVVFNPAAGPLISYLLAHPFDMNNLSIRDWLIPFISGSQHAGDYITVGDIEAGRVDVSFFTNPDAIDIMEEWINLNGVSATTVDDIIEIATSSDKVAAMKAISILSRIKTANGKAICDNLSTKQLSLLLTSHHGYDYAVATLRRTDMSVLLDELLCINKLTPYWICDGPYQYWTLANLNAKTVQHMTPTICAQMKQYVDLITYTDWVILLQTKFGTELGFAHIAYLIEHGVLFAFLRSPFITKEQLIDLYTSTDVFECCDDEDFASLINRDDIYDVDLKAVASFKQQLCMNVLETWYEPTRLVRVAKTQDLDIRKYLQIYD